MLLRYLKSYICNSVAELRFFKSQEQLARLQEIADSNRQQALLARDKQNNGRYLLFNSDIYKYFKSQCQSTGEKRTLNAALWEQLEAEINEDFPGFMEKLKGLYRWSEQEMHICLLQKAEFKNKKLNLRIKR